jgi:membrane protease YdiL (CAAX protease family)
MARSGEPPSVMGLDAHQPGRDLLKGAVLAAVIGGAGLALYLGAYHLGVELNVVPESLPNVWWRIPVLLLSAAHDGILEEILVIGYLLRRLDQLGWTPWKAIVVAAILRGSYHLYQGVGAFVGNAIMGLIFGYLYRRWGRVTPLIIAHTLIDAVTFVGYAALVGKVSWLPPK